MPEGRKPGAGRVARVASAGPVVAALAVALALILAWAAYRDASRPAVKGPDPGRDSAPGADVEDAGPAVAEVAGEAEDLIDSGRIAEARALLAEALGRGDDAGLWRLLGRAHDREGDDRAAERCWNRALEVEPGDADALAQLGRLALRRGRPDEAAILLERAEAGDPDGYEAPYALARAYRMLGRAVDAERASARAAENRRRAGPPRGGMGAMPSHGPRP